MPAVFVHGVPETPAVWDPLIAALARTDIIALQLPGFGCGVPVGFEPTMDRYGQWLADELAAIDGAIDLVGHDWGALLTLRVLAQPDTTVRTWACDAGDLDAGFRWHDTARTWQTPGDGEAMMDGLLAASVADRAEFLQAVGVPGNGAPVMAEAFDQTMAAAILTLYRSATDIGAEWGPGIDDIGGPGLLVESGQDPFRAAGRVAALADRTGARRASLPEAGHWWMLEDPSGAAAILEQFWAAV